MVKPGLAYLDIIHRASYSVWDAIPIFAYQVSGEYAMVKAAGEKGWIDGDAVMLEQLLAFKRAGARAVFTYAALDIAEAMLPMTKIIIGISGASGAIYGIELLKALRSGAGGNASRRHQNQAQL